MDATKLRQFIALAETLHFGKASKQCHVSPSTLSRNISQLEEELNTTLFHRDNRSVVITQDGKQLQQFAKDTLGQWQTLKQMVMANANQLRGALSFYCSVTASYSFLYDILMGFRRQHPLVEILLHTGDPALAVDRVLSGQEDISIAARLDVMPPGVKFKRMTFSPLVFIQPIDACALAWWPQPDSPDFWQTVPYILSEQGVTRQRLDRWFRQKHITPNIYAQVAGHEAIVSMVSLGFGVGVIPKIVLDNSPLSGKVAEAPNAPQLQPYEVGLCVLEKTLKNPLVRAFWEQAPQHINA